MPPPSQWAQASLVASAGLSLSARGFAAYHQTGRPRPGSRRVPGRLHLNALAEQPLAVGGPDAADPGRPAMAAASGIPGRQRPTRTVADHLVRGHDRRDGNRCHPAGAQAHRTGALTGPVHRLPAATASPSRWPAAPLATGLVLIHIGHQPANDVPASAPFRLRGRAGLGVMRPWPTRQPGSGPDRPDRGSRTCPAVPQEDVAGKGTISFLRTRPGV